MEELKERPKPAFKDRLQLHLANERTFLAWTRTSISMIAIGLLVIRFNLTDLPSRSAESTSTFSKSSLFGSLFVILGAATNLIAASRFIHFRKEIEKGEGSFSYASDFILTAFVVIIALFLIIFTTTR